MANEPYEPTNTERMGSLFSRALRKRTEELRQKGSSIESDIAWILESSGEFNPAQRALDHFATSNPDQSDEAYLEQIHATIAAHESHIHAYVTQQHEIRGLYSLPNDDDDPEWRWVASAAHTFLCSPHVLLSQTNRTYGPGPLAPISLVFNKLWNTPAGRAPYSFADRDIKNSLSERFDATARVLTGLVLQSRQGHNKETEIEKTFQHLDGLITEFDQRSAEYGLSKSLYLNGWNPAHFNEGKVKRPPKQYYLDVINAKFDEMGAPDLSAHATTNFSEKHQKRNPLIPDGSGREKK
jgi:hypothetical protein